jgi:uncharacterized protein YegP (UPF0339 family)
MRFPNRPTVGFLRLLAGSAVTLPTRPPERDDLRGPVGIGWQRSRRTIPRQHAYVVRHGQRAGWRWWLEGGNGEQLAAAPVATATMEQAWRDTLRVRLAAATAPVETFEDSRGHFRFRVLTRNGALLAVSAIGYASRSAADRAVATFRRAASHAELHDG